MDKTQVDFITDRIIECAIKVHRLLGNGFQEAVYRKSLALEFELQGLNFEMEKEMPVYFRDKQVGVRKLDFFVEGLIAVEIEAQEKPKVAYRTQKANNLEAYGIADGLCINFGSKNLVFKRIYSKTTPYAGKQEAF